MRPGRTQIGMSYSYRPPLRLHETGLTSSQLLDRDKKLSYRSEFFSSYRSNVNDNKFQTGSRNFKLVCFWGSNMFVRRKDVNQAPSISSRVFMYKAAAKISYWYMFMTVRVCPGTSSIPPHAVYWL